MRIDHVVYATADLDRATELVETTLGVDVVAGGRHEGMGTHNRVAALGGGYLELLAVADAEEAAGSPLGRSVLQFLDHGDGLIGWAVAVEGVEAIAERLGTELIRIARDGMEAKLTGLGEALTDSSVPFFIERGPGIADPGAGGSAGGITWVEAGVDPDRLTEWLGGEELPVRYAAGETGLRAFGVGDRAFP